MIKKVINRLKKGIADFRLKRGFNILGKHIDSCGYNLSTKEAIDFLYSKKGSLITPWQFKSEISNLFTLYKNLNAKYSLEIGTANGGTLFGHCRLANENATIISIDLPGGEFGGGYPDWKTNIYKKFASGKQTLHLIRANSHDPSTIENVTSILSHNELDYLFIDGDHTYKGVKRDFELYKQFVRKGGLIVFHDIVPHKNSLCKVDDFWNEIKKEYQYIEFIDKPNQVCYGVGVLFV